MRDVYIWIKSAIDVPVFELISTAWALLASTETKQIPEMLLLHILMIAKEYSVIYK